MDMIWMLGGFFAFITIAFIALAYFLPEWVGITGKKALEIEEHQRSTPNGAEGSSSDPARGRDQSPS